MSETTTLSTFNVKDLIEPLFVGAAGEAAKAAKLQTIAAEIARAVPHVLGLQEVGSESLVQQIAARLGALTGATYTVVMGTTDARGIGCALVSRLPVTRSHVHLTDALDFPVFDPADPPPFGARLPLRRGIVHAVVESAFGPIEVLVAHFKSRRGVPAKDADGAPVQPVTGGDHGESLIRGLVWRSSEALFVRRIVDGLFAASSEPRIAVLGDLNDDVRSLPLAILRGRRDAALHGSEQLVPPERRFTILHGGEGRGEQIDHILLSPALRERVVAADIQNESLRQHAFPEEGEPPSADSDHALYSVRLA